MSPNLPGPFPDLPGSREFPYTPRLSRTPPRPSGILPSPRGPSPHGGPQAWGGPHDFTEMGRNGRFWYGFGTFLVEPAGRGARGSARPAHKTSRTPLPHKVNPPPPAPRSTPRPPGSTALASRSLFYPLFFIPLGRFLCSYTYSRQPHTPGRWINK